MTLLAAHNCNAHLSKADEMTFISMNADLAGCSSCLIDDGMLDCAQMNAHGPGCIPRRADEPLPKQDKYKKSTALYPGVDSEEIEEIVDGDDDDYADG